MLKMQAISDIVPREAGLEQVVDAILKSENPLHEIALKLGRFLYPEELIIFRGIRGALDASSFITLMVSETKRFLGEGIMPPYGNPLALLMAGDDYLAHSKSDKKGYFWFADALYHLLLPDFNAYNLSFGISLFPEETVSIPEKESLTNDLDNPRFPRNYAHLKTLLLYDRKADRYYIVVVPGRERVNLRNVKGNLGTTDLRFSGDPQEVIGRQSGAVSPLIQERFFSNVERILFAEELMISYPKPRYSLPLDKRSALVLADISGLIEELRNTQGFPEIITFNNH